MLHQVYVFVFGRISKHFLFVSMKLALQEFLSFFRLSQPSSFHLSSCNPSSSLCPSFLSPSHLSLSFQFNLVRHYQKCGNALIKLLRADLLFYCSNYCLVPAHKRVYIQSNKWFIDPVWLVSCFFFLHFLLINCNEQKEAGNDLNRNWKQCTHPVDNKPVGKCWLVKSKKFKVSMTDSIKKIWNVLHFCGTYCRC